MNDGVWIMITDPYAAPKAQRTSKIQLQGPDAVYCICKLFREGRLHINNIVYVGYLCSLVTILQKKFLEKARGIQKVNYFKFISVFRYIMASLISPLIFYFDYKNILVTFGGDF